MNTSSRAITGRLIATSIEKWFPYFETRYKILQFLFNRTEKSATEEYIEAETKIIKDALMYALEDLVENGFISHFFLNGNHCYKLNTLDWEIHITLSPEKIATPKNLANNP